MVQWVLFTLPAIEEQLASQWNERAGNLAMKRNSRSISVLYGLQHSASRAAHTEIPLKGTGSRAIDEIFCYCYSIIKYDQSQCDCLGRWEDISLAGFCYSGFNILNLGAGLHELRLQERLSGARLAKILYPSFSCACALRLLATLSYSTCSMFIFHKETEQIFITQPPSDF